MATDWMWAVAIVFAGFGWTMAMVDRRECRMEKNDDSHMFGLMQDDIIQNPTGDWSYRWLTVRPDRLLQMMGDLVEDYGTREGWELLWDVFYDMKFSYSLMAAVRLAVYTESTEDTSLRVWDDIYVIDGRGLLFCLDNCPDRVHLDVKAMGDMDRDISRVRKYFTDHGLLDKRVKGKFFVCDPEDANRFYPYMAIPTHKYNVYKDWPKDE